MSWSSRSYPQPIPMDQPLEIPSDLPVPSTSRVLQPRSRAASLVRSASGSRPGSRSASISGDARVHGSNELYLPGPSTGTQENLDWFDNNQNMQQFFDSSALFAPLPEYNMPPSEPSQMDYQDYRGGFDLDPMEWNGFGHDLNAQEGFSYNNDSNNDPSPNRRKRKRNDADDSNLIPLHAPEQSNSEVKGNTPSFPFQPQGESSASGSSGRGIQRKKYNFKFSSNQPDGQSQFVDPSALTTVEGGQSALMNSSSVPVSQEYSNEDRKGKGKARAQTPDPTSIIEISDSPPTKAKSPITTKPPNEPLSAYTCPICFSPPTNATLTPCGHICCGACLFAALKSTMQRSAIAIHGGIGEARCPVCRAIIPGWDGKGGGVIGLKPRAIFRL